MEKSIITRNYEAAINLDGIIYIGWWEWKSSPGVNMLGLTQVQDLALMMVPWAPLGGISEMTARRKHKHKTAGVSPKQNKIQKEINKQQQQTTVQGDISYFSGTEYTLYT